MTRKLRWGVMGVGGIAQRQMIPAIQGSQNGTIAFLGTRRADAVRELAASAGGCATGSYDDLLADPEIDAVYIALPNALHAEWALRAAEAGKAVLCEKPLATTAADAARIVSAFAARKLPLMEGFMYRFHPQHRRIRELLADGAIGDLREVRAHLSVDHSQTTDTQNVRFLPETGGGALLDMGCYTVNVVRWMFGSEPRSASALWDFDQQRQTDAGIAGVLDFGDGRFGIVSCTFRAGGQGFYTLVGTRGSIHVPRAIIPGVGPRLAETMLVVSDVTGSQTTEVFAAAAQYRLMIEAFADAVLRGDAVPFPPDDAVANARVVDALAAAAREQRTVQIGGSA